MQFETRIVNGKPSIFYKEGKLFEKLFKTQNFSDLKENNFKEPSRIAAAKKVTTKDKEKKKEIRKSLGVGGEIDMVKPSPRENAKNSKSTKGNLMNSTLSKNGINLTEAQLAAILNAIQNNEITIKKGKIIFEWTANSHSMSQIKSRSFLFSLQQFNLIYHG